MHLLCGHSGRRRSTHFNSLPCIQYMQTCCEDLDIHSQLALLCIMHLLHLDTRAGLKYTRLVMGTIQNLYVGSFQSCQSNSRAHLQFTTHAFSRAHLTAGPPNFVHSGFWRCGALGNFNVRLHISIISLLLYLQLGDIDDFNIYLIQFRGFWIYQTRYRF